MTWDVATGACLQVFKGHALGLSDVCWSSDSHMLATASDDTTVGLWDVGTGRMRSQLRGHELYVIAVAFNPQGNMVVSASFDESIRLWDVRHGQCVRSFAAHSGPFGGCLARATASDCDIVFGRSGQLGGLLR